jgi:Trk K+ transport system NAD-binding subunit
VLALAQVTKRTARDLIDTLVEEGAIQFVNVEGSAAQHFVPASADPALLVGATIADPYAPSPLD